MGIKWGKCAQENVDNVDKWKIEQIFVQLARFTIMYKDFVELWCPHDGEGQEPGRSLGAPDREQTVTELLAEC